MFDPIGIALILLFAAGTTTATYGSIAPERGWAVGTLFVSPPPVLLLLAWGSVLASLGVSIFVGPWWRVLATIGLGMTACSIVVPLLRSLIQPVALLGIFGSGIWLITLFGEDGSSQRRIPEIWPIERKQAYVSRCAATVVQQLPSQSAPRRACQCLADSLEAEFGISEYQAMMEAQPDAQGSKIDRRLHRVVTACMK